MITNKNFFDELNQDWGDIIGDIYKGNQVNIINILNDKFIYYGIKPKYAADKVYLKANNLSTNISAFNNIDVVINRHYTDIIYGNINASEINTEYVTELEGEEVTKVYNYNDFDKVELFMFLIDDRSFILRIFPLSTLCYIKKPDVYSSFSMQYEIILDYRYKTNEFFVKVKSNQKVVSDIDINPKFLDYILSNILKLEQSNKALSNAFKILMDAYLEQR